MLRHKIRRKILSTLSVKNHLMGILLHHFKLYLCFKIKYFTHPTSYIVLDNYIRFMSTRTKCTEVLFLKEIYYLKLLKEMIYGMTLLKGVISRSILIPMYGILIYLVFIRHR